MIYVIIFGILDVGPSSFLNLAFVVLYLLHLNFALSSLMCWELYHIVFTNTFRE